MRVQGDVYQWTGELSQAANTILHQHAIQGDITDVQQSMCRWRAYSRKHRQHPFDWSLLLRLLEDLDEKWEPASLNRDEVSVGRGASLAQQGRGKPRGWGARSSWSTP